MGEVMGYVKQSNAKGFSFKGRARRYEYWSVYLYYSILTMIVFVGGLILFGIYGALTATGDFTDGLGESLLLLLLLLVWSVYCLVRTLPVSIRRLHDVGLPGWTYIIAMFFGVTSIFMIVVGCLEGNPGENKYGHNPKEVENRSSGLDPSFYE